MDINVFRLKLIASLISLTFLVSCIGAPEFDGTCGKGYWNNYFGISGGQKKQVDGNSNGSVLIFKAVSGNISKPERSKALAVIPEWLKKLNQDFFKRQLVGGVWDAGIEMNFLEDAIFAADSQFRNILESGNSDFLVFRFIESRIASNSNLNFGDLFACRFEDKAVPCFEGGWNNFAFIKRKPNEDFSVVQIKNGVGNPTEQLLGLDLCLFSAMEDLYLKGLDLNGNPILSFSESRVPNSSYQNAVLDDLLGPENLDLKASSAYSAGDFEAWKKNFLDKKSKVNQLLECKSIDSNSESSASNLNRAELIQQAFSDQLNQCRARSIQYTRGTESEAYRAGLASAARTCGGISIEIPTGSISEVQLLKFDAEVFKLQDHLSNKAASPLGTPFNEVPVVKGVEDLLSDSKFNACDEKDPNYGTEKCPGTSKNGAQNFNTTSTSSSSASSGSVASSGFTVKGGPLNSGVTGANVAVTQSAQGTGMQSDSAKESQGLYATAGSVQTGGALNKTKNSSDFGALRPQPDSDQNLKNTSKGRTGTGGAGGAGSSGSIFGSGGLGSEPTGAGQKAGEAEPKSFSNLFEIGEKSGQWGGLNSASASSESGASPDLGDLGSANSGGDAKFGATHHTTDDKSLTDSSLGADSTLGLIERVRQGYRKHAKEISKPKNSSKQKTGDTP